MLKIKKRNYVISLVSVALSSAGRRNYSHFPRSESFLNSVTFEIKD